MRFSFHRAKELEMDKQYVTVDGHGCFKYIGLKRVNISFVSRCREKAQKPRQVERVAATSFRTQCLFNDCAMTAREKHIHISRSLGVWWPHIATAHFINFFHMQYYRTSKRKKNTHTAHWNVCTLTRSNVQWVEPSNQTNRTTYESYIEWARRRVQCRARAKNWQMIRFHSSMRTCGAPSQMPNVCVCVNGWYYRDMVISINQIFFVYFDHFHLARRGR